MNKKLLVSVFLCFFVFSLGMIAQEKWEEKEKILKAETEKAGNIIYVNDATGDDKKGDGTEKKPFKTITKALSVSDSWDIINVGPGIYNENLRLTNIDKITIQGSGIGSSVINGVVAYFCDYLRIEGFTISGRQIYLEGVERAVIVDCDISENELKGVFVNNHSTAWIYNCQIYNNGWEGVRVSYSSRAYLNNCTISNNNKVWALGGISAWVLSSVSIINCEVENPSNWGILVGWNSHLFMYGSSVYYSEIGIHVAQSSVADLFHVDEEGWNYIYGNQTGIRTQSNSHVSIAYADIKNNEWHGILVAGTSFLKLWFDVAISGNGIGVIVEDFATAVIGDVNIAGNNVGVHIQRDSQASCNPDTIFDNTTNIISNCEHCPPKL